MVTSYEHPSVTYYRKLLERQLKPGVGDSIARSARPFLSISAESTLWHDTTQSNFVVHSLLIVGTR
jgi:hypothetical protein